MLKISIHSEFSRWFRSRSMPRSYRNRGTPLFFKWMHNLCGVSFLRCDISGNTTRVRNVYTHVNWEYYRHICSWASDMRGANQHTYNFLSIKHEANSWLVSRRSINSLATLYVQLENVLKRIAMTGFENPWRSNEQSL